MSEIENTSCVRIFMMVTLVSRIEREHWGADSSLKESMMECKYVNVQPDVMNISVRQNMHLFMTVTSNHFIIKNVVGLSLIIELMNLFLLWRINKEIQGSIRDMT